MRLCVNFFEGAKGAVYVWMSAWPKYVLTEVAHILSIMELKELATLCICYP